MDHPNIIWYLYMHRYYCRLGKSQFNLLVETKHFERFHTTFFCEEGERQIAGLLGRRLLPNSGFKFGGSSEIASPRTSLHSFGRVCLAMIVRRPTPVDFGFRFCLCRALSALGCGACDQLVQTLRPWSERVFPYQTWAKAWVDLEGVVGQRWSLQQLTVHCQHVAGWLGQTRPCNQPTDPQEDSRLLVQAIERENRLKRDQILLKFDCAVSEPISLPAFFLSGAHVNTSPQQDPAWQARFGHLAFSERLVELTHPSISRQLPPRSGCCSLVASCLRFTAETTAEVSLIVLAQQTSGIALATIGHNCYADKPMRQN